MDRTPCLNRLRRRSARVRAASPPLEHFCTALGVTIHCGKRSLRMNDGTSGFNRRRFIAGGAGLLAAANAAFGQKGSYSDSNFAGGPIAGSFRPNWESLKAYRYPDWFRDAKFGIWAH